MAKIRNTHKIRTLEYYRAQTAASQYEESNDCTVKCLSILCEVSYDEAHGLLTKLGRRRRKGVHTSVLCSAFDELGYNSKSIGRSGIERIIAKYPGAGKNLKNITTHHPDRYRRVWENFPPMALFTTGFWHVSAFKDGMLHDWARGRALRIADIWLIKPKGVKIEFTI